MKYSPVRALVWFWLFVWSALWPANSVSAAEKIDAARIQEIAAMLPAQPAGFAWPITNRAAWHQLAANPAFSDTVTTAAGLLAKPLPEQPDSLFLEYSKNGNRTHWQDVAFERRGRIAKFTLAEAFENQGRFLPALEATIAALCAEKTWVYPAHDGGLKNFRGEEIVPELGATGLAAELAEADFVLGDKLSPATRRLIRDNVRRRVLVPFRDSVEGRRQPPLHWLFVRMNWNAVCVGNTVFAALALEPSRGDRAFYAAAGERYIKYFLSGFGPDGYCAEGIGYWNYGFGHFILLTEALRQATGGKMDLFEGDAIAPALFCRHAEIFPGIFPTIADCSPGTRPSPQLTAYVCGRLGLNAGQNKLVGDAKNLPLTLLLASLDGNLPRAHITEKFSDDPLRSFFPDGGVLISRTATAVEPPMAVVLKGGNNNEPHNHNDVGSFSVVVGTNLVVCDPGGEVYTKRTFSAHRYDSKVLSSFGHAVPVIAGELQRAGREARGVILETNFTAAADMLALDIRSAYAVPDLEKLIRTFVFQREPKASLEVRDEVKFSKPQAFETALVTWGKIKIINATTLEIADGNSGVRVVIDTQGRAFRLKQETIDEDVHSKRKPVRLGIALDEQVAAATVVLRISPVEK